MSSLRNLMLGAVALFGVAPAAQATLSSYDLGTTSTIFLDVPNNQAGWNADFSFNLGATGDFHITNPMFGDIGVQIVGYTTITITSGDFSWQMTRDVEDEEWCCKNGTVGTVPYDRTLHQDYGFHLIDITGTSLATPGTHVLDVTIDTSHVSLHDYAAHVDNPVMFLKDAHLQSIVFGDPAAVPEPASWAMMLGGFGIIGGALRRRRAAVTCG